MADEIIVDIKTKFLSESHSIYMLFPGEGYKHYHTMRDESVVFLDIVAFPMPASGVVADSGDLIERLVVSDRVRDWYSKGSPEDSLPPRTVDEVSSYRRTEYRRQFAGAIGRFFSYIKRGDIIVVPPQSAEGEILFGEIIDDVDTPSYVVSPDYPEESIPCRKIAWLGRRRRQDAPQWLVKKIASPNPLRQFDRSQYSFIHDEMYERYYYDGNFHCKLSVSSTEFSSLDNFLIQQLVLYPTAIYRDALTSEEYDEITKLPISVAISKLSFSNDIPDQRISINSPGHIVVYGRNLLPLIVGVIVSAASVSPTDAGPRNSPQIRIVNSVDSTAASKKCQGDVQSEITADLNAIGYSRWREICLIEHEIRNRTSLDPGMPATTGTIRTPRGGSQ